MLGIKRQRGEAGLAGPALQAAEYSRTASMSKKMACTAQQKQPMFITSMGAGKRNLIGFCLLAELVTFLENPTPNLMSLCHFHHSQITMDSIKSGEAVDHLKGVRDNAEKRNRASSRDLETGHWCWQQRAQTMGGAL